VFSALEQTLSEKYAAHSTKNSYFEKPSCKENSVKDNWFCSNQNEDKRFCESRYNKNCKGLGYCGSMLFE